MRTLIIIMLGYVLLAICIGVAKALSGGDKLPVAQAVRVFIAVWFVIAASNMWMGVVKAGYGVSSELPIFLLIFFLPTAAALFIHLRAS